jgi:hypothetical protein
MQTTNARQLLQHKDMSGSWIVVVLQQKRELFSVTYASPLDAQHRMAASLELDAD